MTDRVFDESWKPASAHAFEELDRAMRERRRRPRDAYTFYGTTAGAGRTYMGFDGSRADDEPVFARDLGEHVRVGDTMVPVAPTYRIYDDRYPLETFTVHVITTIPHRDPHVPYVANGSAP